jgi:hypothetical protein
MELKIDKIPVSRHLNQIQRKANASAEDIESENNNPFRVHEDDEFTSDVQVTSPDQSWRNFIVSVLLICGWYATSISLSVYNKFLFSKDKFNFYPLFTTTIHQVMQYCLSLFILTYFAPSLMPQSNLPMRAYFTKIVPCAVTTGVEIGLSNSSLHVFQPQF